MQRRLPDSAGPHTHGKRVAAAERNGLLSHPFSSFLSDSTHR
ncbi:hypothetical protein ACNA6I_18385 [Rossellomorea sp. FS2]